MVTNWTITQLERLTTNGFVTAAHWNATAINENYSHNIYGACSLPDGELIIPYNELTQDIVLNWVWSNGVNKDEIEANLANQIELQKNPVSATGLPW